MRNTLNQWMNRFSIFILGYILTLASAKANPGNMARGFDIKDGLPSYNIANITQDDKGIIWIGTWNGLSFFNGERFYTFRSSDTKGKLSTNRIIDMQSDRNNNIWFCTYDSRLNLLDKDDGRIISISEFLQPEPALPSISHIYRSQNAMWGVSADRKDLFKISYNDKSPHGYDVSLLTVADLIPGATQFLETIRDEKGNSWIVTDKKSYLEGTSLQVDGQLAGCAEMNGKSFLMMRDGDLYSMYEDKLKSEPSLKGFGMVRDILEINNSHIGCATTDGYAVYDLKTRKWQTYPITGGITKMKADSNHRIWMFGGNGEILMAYGPAAPAIVPFDSQKAKQQTVFYQPVIHEDNYGTLWLAQAHGPLGYYDESKGEIVSDSIILPRLRYKALPTVESYFVDKSGNMWIKSSSGLAFIKFTYKNVKEIPVEENHETRSILITSDGHLLAGAVDGVIAKYDLKGNRIGYLSYIPIDDSKGQLSISKEYKKFSDRIYALHEDQEGDIWVGTKGSGMYRIKKDGRVDHYSKSHLPDKSLKMNVFYGFDTDKKGRLWAASYDQGPILITSTSTGSLDFTYLADLPGYPDASGARNIRRITHDDDGLIVLSTNGGLITFRDDFKDVKDIKFTIFNSDMSNNESLSTNHVMQTLFTKYGWALVSPMGGEVQSILKDDLTEGKIKFRKPVSEELSRLLSRDNVQSMIEDNDGDLYFVRDTDIIRYASSDSAISVIGSGILGDDYEFTEGMPVKDAEGNLYFCTLGGVIKLEPKSLNKDTAQPTIMFTSMQTPKNGLERLLIPSEKIVVEPGNRDFSLSFTTEDYTGIGHTEYAYKFGQGGHWTYIGTDNTLRISGLSPGTHRLYIKSTNAEGTWCDNENFIDIEVKPLFRESIWAKLLWALLIMVLIGAGTWIYISNRRNRLMAQLRQREHNFYVNASHKLRTPLSLIGSPVYEVLNNENLSETGRDHLERVRRNAKNMLQVLNSMLESEFKDFRQYGKGAADAITLSTVPEGNSSYMTSENWLEVRDESEDISRQDITILIVEDNDDLRGFLHDILQSTYKILTASNGKEGLSIAESIQPDFILTDVTMPEMNGLTMVKKIKSHKELCHIPIIVLSAKTSMADKMEGLRAGIDDYISKPFSATYLRQRIANILSQREMLQRSFMEQLGSRMNRTEEDEKENPDSELRQPHEGATEVPDSQKYRLSAPQIIEEDNLMMEKLVKFIEERIGDENLKIDDMANAVGMGRTVFYGKIKAIVGLAPSDFLRKLRMQRAEDLIVRSNLTFSQVSFSVGFSDPKYFTKCFKKETGMTPSEYRKQKRGEQDNKQ